MHDQIAIADGVANWTALGIKCSEELAKAISLFETLRYVEVGHQPAVELDGLTAKNAENRIAELASALVLATSFGSGKHGPLEQAKAKYLEAQARVVNRLARTAVPDAIDQLTPAFEAHAEAYLSAAAKLPDDLSSEGLVKAGAEVLGAYEDLQRAARHLGRYDSWLASTAALAGARSDVVLRILRPGSAVELAKLDAAKDRPANATVRAINAVWYAAAREGIPFALNTAEESAELRAMASPALVAR